MTEGRLALYDGQARYQPVNIQNLRIGMYVAPQRVCSKTSDVPVLVSGPIETEEQIRRYQEDGVKLLWIDRQSGKSLEDFPELAESVASVTSADQSRRKPEALSDHAKTLRSKGIEMLGPDWDEACESSGLHPEQIARLPRTEDLQQAMMAREVAMRQVDVILSGAKTGIPIEAEAIKDTTNHLLSSILDCPTAMQFILGSDRDSHSHEVMIAHAVHVATLTILVGKHTEDEGFDRLYCHGLGAVLHDIGELHLPVQVHTSTVLSGHERRLVERHPDLGMRMVRNIPGIPEEAIRIVGEHHERMDGRGYPHGLQGRRIYEGSQLVGAIDTYDAMLSSRMYRQALDPAEAIRAVYRMAQQARWDEIIVSRIVATLGVFPVATTVLLNTNQEAMVVMINKDRLRPVVRLMTDRGGQPMTRTKLIDLQEQQDVWIVRLLEDRPGSSRSAMSARVNSQDSLTVAHG